MRVGAAATILLPAHGLPLQLVGRLVRVDAERDAAELAEPDEAGLRVGGVVARLLLNTALLPTEDVQSVPHHGMVHVFGRLSSVPGSGGPLGVARVMRVEIMRRVDGADMVSWAGMAARRDAFLGAMVPKAP